MANKNRTMSRKDRRRVSKTTKALRRREEFFALAKKEGYQVIRDDAGNSIGAFASSGAAEWY